MDNRGMLGASDANAACVLCTCLLLTLPVGCWLMGLLGVWAMRGPGPWPSTSASAM